jgi:hypothetical protein
MFSSLYRRAAWDISARGITVSGAQGILAVSKLINKGCEWDNLHGDIISWK